MSNTILLVGILDGLCEVLAFVMFSTGLYSLIAGKFRLFGSNLKGRHAREAGIYLVLPLFLFLLINALLFDSIDGIMLLGAHIIMWLLFIPAILFGTISYAKSKTPAAQQHLQRASRFFMKEDFDRALIECRAALALEPKLAEAHNLHGEVLDDMGRLEEAIGAYRKAVWIDPTFTDALTNLAEAESELVSKSPSK